MVEVGSTVQFTRKFLQSIGTYTGGAPFQRGVVTKITGSGTFILASVDWAEVSLPPTYQEAHSSRCHINNLKDVSSLEAV